MNKQTERLANTWVFYITFARDLDWTRYSLESFKKYCSGFAGVMIVVPTWDLDKFKQFERYSSPDCPVIIKASMDYPGRGFCHHLAMKCFADVWCPEADFILHMDPDCLFTNATTPDDYFEGGKPVLLKESYEHLKTVHPGRYNWKHCTDRALGFETTHETMCRHPAVHHRSAYRLMRDHIEAVQKEPFYDYVIKQQNAYPSGFCEFNALGGYALKFLEDRYHWIERLPDGSNDPEPHLLQMWSYEGVNKNMDKIKKILL